MSSLNDARIYSLERSNTKNPKPQHPATLSTLYAARQGALPIEGNQERLSEAASNYEPGTIHRGVFADARRVTHEGKRISRLLDLSRLFRGLGGKSRRRNKKGKKKTSKRRRRN